MKPQVARALAEKLAFRETGPLRGELDIGGRTVQLAHIGRGNFAEVYRDEKDPGTVYSLVAAEVPDKDVAAAAHRRLPNNPHLPIAEFVGTLPRELRNVYRMPYYKTPPPRNSKAETDRSALDECRSVDLASTITCARYSDVTPHVLEALEVLADEADASGFDYMFEFPPKNVAVDAADRLVLLDVLYPGLRRF